MKKKITSLFAMALMFAGVANAQVEELQGYKTVTVNDEVLTMDQIVPETQWYAVYQQRNGGGYWWAATPEHNASKGYAENTVCMSVGTEVLDNMPIASTVAAYIVRFLPTDTEGTFNVQFGNGTYMMSAGHNTVVKYTADIAEAAQVRMYNIVTEDGTVNEGHWGFNFADNDIRIDNNGQSNSVAGWDPGTITTTGGNNDHQIFSIAIGETSEFEALKNEAIAVFNEYMQYYGTFTDVQPGVPGHYSAEAVAAFEAALEEGAAIEDADESWTAEMFQAIVDKIESTYQAVLDSRVPFATEVTEGYYLIQTSPFFYYTTEEVEDPETGEMLPGETVNLSKGLCAAPDGEAFRAAWNTYDATADNRAVFLWKVTSKGDKKYQLRNMGYDVNAALWNGGKLQLQDADSTVVFDYNAYVDDDGNKYYNIRPSQNKEREYNYLHCGEHQSGAGVSGWIVNWSAGEGGASEWKLIPVSEADAQAMIDAFAPVKEAEARLIDAEAMVADVEPKLVIAEDNSVGLSDEPLITDVTQISSPYTNINQGEGSLEGMIDGITSGEGMAWYWHSDWSAAVANGTHYFQVELPDEVPAEIAFEYTRRAVNGNQITKWGIYGTDTNDETVARDACTLLANIVTPFGSIDETVVSNTFKTQGFKYVRFYCDGTDALPGEQKDKGFFHIAEFQLYAATTIVNETSQAIFMGDVYKNMQATVAKAKVELEAEEPAISVETYNELKAAYDAFIAMFVNPDTLRNKIEAIDGIEKYIVTGDAPGYWKDNATAKGVTDAVAAAKAYDKAGQYTLANSQAQIAALDAAKENMMNAANKVQEGKWYQFQFASDALYTEQGWDMAGADANVNTETGTTKYPALYSRIVCAGELVNDGTEEDPMYETYPASETPAGTGLYYMDENQLDEDYSLFRFVEVGDSGAYIIQNKATGLFLYTAGGAVTLQPAATTFKANAMGFGKVIVTGHNPNGDYVEYLHAQRNGNSLVTWGADGVESNTGFMVIENSDVADYTAPDFQISMVPNSMSSYCFPVDITAVDGELLGVEINGSDITLSKMADKTAKAGEPFIYVNGDLAAYDAEAEAVLVNFTHGYNVVAEPKAVGKHIGTFYGLSGDDAAAKGNVVVKATGLEIAKASSNVGAFGSYIKAELEADATLNVQFGEGTFDSIQEVVNQAVKGGNIYTIDGKFVGKGNLNTKLSRGMYIINGVKVIVK